MKLIIDRFEGDYAVCEKDDLSFVDVPVSQIPNNASEGTVLDLTDGVYTVDEKETALRRRKMRQLLNELFKQ